MPPSAVAISSSLPATPVSTTIASPPRTRMYADTNPRFTRVQAAGPPESGGGLAEARVAPPDAPAGDAPAEPDAFEGRDDAAVNDDPHPATDRRASATDPRPRSARNARRVNAVAVMRTLNHRCRSRPAGGRLSVARGRYHRP